MNGLIEPGALGHCQTHEHLIVREGPATRAHPALLIDDEALSLRELCAYGIAGGRSIVDCQPGGAGRDARSLRRMGEASGIHIIAVTGYHMPMFYARDHRIFTDSEAMLTERFLMELREGMDGTDIRAGAVKAAIGRDGAAGRFAAQLSAAARAAALARVPLILHTEMGACALDALRICEAQGLPPDRVLVCHADRQAHDFAPHEQLARAGAMLEYDTIARHKYHDDASEIRLILHMLSRGYADRLLLSMDTTRERLAAYGGAPGLSFILGEFLPALKNAGASAREVRAMSVDNAMRVFTR